MAVVDDADGSDAVPVGVVALQHDADGDGLGVDGVPHQLDQGPHRVAFVGQALDVVLASLELQIIHERTLSGRHRRFPDAGRRVQDYRRANGHWC